MYRSKYAIGLMVGAGLTFSSGLFGAEVVIPSLAPAGTETQQSSVNESDAADGQFDTLRELLDDMLDPQSGDQPKVEADLDPERQKAYGELSAILAKAAKADVLEREVDELWKQVEVVRQQILHLEEELAATRADRDAMRQELDAFQKQAEKWESIAAGLRETIQRLLLGEFEYYEVQEGDTLQSIAANPMVYGDVSRAAWIRQVNEGMVKHLDNLRVGEVLVIPRFPRTGGYEF